MRRVKALGLEWHDVVEKVGLSRPTGFRLKKGTAGIGSIRKIEEWLVTAEQGARAKAAPQPSKDGPTADWSALGEEFYLLDPKQFDEMLEHMREFVDGIKKSRGAISKMLRANPDRPR